MKILAVADSHGSSIPLTIAERNLDCFDKVIFLGDFFGHEDKEYVKALECNVLVLGGKISCELANKIYPGLNLSFNDDTDVIKFHDGVLFVSIKHPSRIGYAYVAEIANKISDAYKEIK